MTYVQRQLNRDIRRQHAVQAINLIRASFAITQGGAGDAGST